MSIRRGFAISIALEKGPKLAWKASRSTGVKANRLGADPRNRVPSIDRHCHSTRKGSMDCSQPACKLHRIESTWHRHFFLLGVQCWKRTRDMDQAAPDVGTSTVT